MNCVTDSSLSLLPKQCAGFCLLAKQSNLAIINPYCRFLFLFGLATDKNVKWICNIEPSASQWCNFCLLTDQIILNFHPSHNTIQCSPWGVHCAPSLLCSVVHCTVYSGVQCTLCGLWRALLHCKYALHGLRFPSLKKSFKSFLLFYQNYQNVHKILKV